jgi:hypothetical protein
VCVLAACDRQALWDQECHAEIFKLQALLGVLRASAVGSANLSLSQTFMIEEVPVDISGGRHDETRSENRAILFA